MLTKTTSSWSSNGDRTIWIPFEITWCNTSIYVVHVRVNYIQKGNEVSDYKQRVIFCSHWWSRKLVCLDEPRHHSFATTLCILCYSQNGLLCVTGTSLAIRAAKRWNLDCHHHQVVTTIPSGNLIRGLSNWRWEFDISVVIVWGWRLDLKLLDEIGNCIWGSAKL